MKILLEDPRVDPSADDNNAIMEASDHGFGLIVRELIKDKRVRKTLRKEDIKGLIEREYKLYKLSQLKKNKVHF